MATELTNPQADRPAVTVEGQVFEISKSVTFEAAHRLPGRAANDPYGRVHGHSFRLEAAVAGTVSTGEKWVVDIAVLADALEYVASQLDHQLLNDVPGLDVPTLEAIAVWVAARLQPDFPGLTRVTLSRPSLSERCTLRLTD